MFSGSFHPFYREVPLNSIKVTLKIITRIGQEAYLLKSDASIETNKASAPTLTVVSEAHL